MAEQYQLPPQFQAPSMAEVSYQAGDSQAADNANFALFTDQINKYTNIQNANRDISLREKQFQNLVVQNDRDYVLRRERQDQDIRNGDITYEINKFNFDRNRENYNQLQEAWGQREKWVEGIDNLMPSGGNSPTYLRDKARAFRLFAKNPSSYAVLNELFKPYDEQYRVYQANKSLEDEAEVQSAFESGLLDNEKIGDQDATAYFRDIILNREADPVSYAAGMRNLKRIAGIAQEDVARQRQALLDAKTKGQFEAEAFGAGATDVELKMEGGKIVRTAKTPRPSLTGRGTTDGGARTFTSMADTYQGMGIKAAERAKELKEEAELATDEVEKTSLQIQSDAKLREAEEYNTRALQAGRAAGTAIPNAGGTAPATQSGLPTNAGARGVLAPSLREVKKPAPQGAPAPTPPQQEKPSVSSLESTLSPGARTALSAGKGAVGAVSGVAEQALGAIPGARAAISATKTIEPALAFAESAGSVARELAQYSKNVSRAEKAARERAKKGENFQAALLDEQRKIIEELSQAADSKSSVTSKL